MTVLGHRLSEALRACFKKLGRAAGFGGSPAATLSPGVKLSILPGASVDAVDPRRFRLASQLIGAPVENLEGEYIGTIDNLILDSARGVILVALVLTTPGDGRPEIHLEIPWSAVINRGLDDLDVPFLVDLDAEELQRQRASLSACYSKPETRGL